MMSGEHNQYQKTIGYAMNKRIKLLAEQCRLKSYGINGELLDVDFDEGKFAQLIVEECADVAWRNTPETEELDYSHLISDKIKRHFGFES